MSGNDEIEFLKSHAVLPASLPFSDGVRVQIMLAGMADWTRFNEVYREFFSEPWPARSAFGANGLALGARVEVEAYAITRA